MVRSGQKMTTSTPQICNDLAKFHVTKQDDTGTMKGLVRGEKYEKMDFSRTVVLSTGHSAYESLFIVGQSGFEAVLEIVWLCLRL